MYNVHKCAKLVTRMRTKSETEKELEKVYIQVRCKMRDQLETIDFLFRCTFSYITFPCSVSIKTTTDMP